MNSILYEKEITLNAIDSAYEKGKKEGTIEELENIKASIKQFMFDINPNSSESDYACNYILNEIQNRISELKEQ